MMFTIIKNSLLAILIILILHFIVKNEIFDDVEKMKKKIVQAVEKQNEKVLPIVPVIPQPFEENKYDENVNLEKKSQGEDVDYAKNKDYKEYVKECKNALTCSDFKLPENVQESNQMKELYEYVFMNEDDSLDKQFQNAKGNIAVDMTELDHHIKEIAATQHSNTDDLLCSFEVIGLIDSQEIDGLDAFSQTHLFSKVI
jgi:hypothetical protein